MLIGGLNMKPFLNLDMQILKIYSRGMYINSLPKYKEFLLRKNYYNSVNVYGRLFLKPNSKDKYINKSKFSEVQALYYFDKELRDLSFKKIIEVEANLRSTVAHIFSKYYPQKNSHTKTISFNLLDRSGNICPEKIKDFSYIQNQFDKIIRKNFNRLNPNISSVDHYMRMYGYVPFWVIVNYLTFGQLVLFVKLLEDRIINEIAKSFSDSISKSYGIFVSFSRHVFINYISILHDLRNRVAHDNTLLFYKSRKHPRHSKFLHTSRGISNTRSANSFFHSIINCQMFISKTTS